MASDTEYVAHHMEDAAQQREAAGLGMWTFLASEILFFGGLLLSYTVMRLLHPQEFAEGSHHLSVPLGTLNTGILLVSSLFMAMAEQVVKRGRPKLLALYLGLVLVFGLTFLGIKFYEYHIEWSEGFVPVLNWTHPGGPNAMELFFFLYFTMTALHAIHMIAGLSVVSALLIGIRRGNIGQHRPIPVEMTALYWHFVDIVWIFLFPLLYLVGTHAQ